LVIETQGVVDQIPELTSIEFKLLVKEDNEGDPEAMLYLHPDTSVPEFDTFLNISVLKRGFKNATLAEIRTKLYAGWSPTADALSNFATGRFGMRNLHPDAEPTGKDLLHRGQLAIFLAFVGPVIGWVRPPAEVFIVSSEDPE
jgi:hypothetical protein